MYRYKIKQSFWRSGMAKEWQQCTKQQAEKLERMRPNSYLIEEIKPPAPTPSMIAPKEEKKAKKAKKQMDSKEISK